MKKQLVVFFFSLCTFLAKAQDPNWTINSAGYQHSMTFTAFLNVNGTTLSSTDDKVAAFVNGEIRGVANLVYVANANKYVAYLTVYANTSGETISFKIYDSTNDTVVDIVETQTFVIDGNIGGIFQSYSIANPPLSDQVVLNSFNFLGITSVSQTIANNKIDIVLPSQTDITNLIAEYSLSDGANFFVNNVQQTSGVSTQDFTNTVIYTILSENEAVAVQYEVNVTVSEEIPTLVLTSTAEPFVKQAPVSVNLQTNVAITGFTTQDVLLENAIITTITTNDALNYTLEIVPIQQGNFSLEIPENAVFNSQGNGNSASNKLTFTYDIVNPYVVSVKRKNPIDEITNMSTLDFTIVFNEAVENVLETDFESVTDASFTILKENDSTYTITVNNIQNHTGTLTLDIKTSNTIKDKAGNLLINSVIKPHQN